MTEPLWTIWWAWLAGALVLGIAEVLLPGFIFLGFAIGAVVTGLLLLVPGFSVSLPVLVLVFAALSLIAWLLLRRMFALPHGQVKHFDEDING